MSDEKLQTFHLDEEIGILLNRTDIAEYEKSKRYAELLRQYLSYQQNKNTAGDRALPAPTPTESSTVVDGTKPQRSQTYSKDDILNAIPEKFRGKAISMINLLKTQPSLLDWNDRGEIIYKGDLVPRSHVTDLLRIAVLPKARGDVVGAPVFTQALREMNIPEGVVGNRKFKEALRVKKYGDIQDTLPQSDSSFEMASPKVMLRTAKKVNKQTAVPYEKPKRRKKLQFSAGLSAAKKPNGTSTSHSTQPKSDPSIILLSITFSVIILDFLSL